MTQENLLERYGVKLMKNVKGMLETLFGVSEMASYKGILNETGILEDDFWYDDLTEYEVSAVQSLETRYEYIVAFQQRLLETAWLRYFQETLSNQESKLSPDAILGLYNDYPLQPTTVTIDTIHTAVNTTLSTLYSPLNGYSKWVMYVPSIGMVRLAPPNPAKITSGWRINAYTNYVQALVVSVFYDNLFNTLREMEMISKADTQDAIPDKSYQQIQAIIKSLKVLQDNAVYASTKQKTITLGYINAMYPKLKAVLKQYPEIQYLVAHGSDLGHVINCTHIGPTQEFAISGITKDFRQRKTVAIAPEFDASVVTDAETNATDTN